MSIAVFQSSYHAHLQVQAPRPFQVHRGRFRGQLRVGCGQVQVDGQVGVVEGAGESVVRRRFVISRQRPGQSHGGVPNRRASSPRCVCVVL